MTTSNLIRLGGPAAILGGVLFIVTWVLGGFAESGALNGAFFEFFRVLTMALLTVGVAGLYLYQSRRFGKLGKAGFYLSLAGFSVAAIGGLAIILVELVISKDSTPIWLAAITHLLAAGMYFIGSMIFAIATYRARALPRGGALLLIAGPLLSVAFGAGWAWLGYALYFSDRRMVPAQQEPSGTTSAWEHEGRGWRSETKTAAVLLAVLLGVIPAVVLLATLFSDVPGVPSFELYVLGRIGIVAALQAAFGVAFGLAIPEPTWRWGLWLNVPPLFLLAFAIPTYLSSLAMGNVDLGQAQHRTEALLLIGFFAGALAAGCLGAYGGARARLHFSSE